MIAWLFLLVLIVAEVAVLWWWLHKEYYPVIFNTWAPLFYSAVLLADFVLAWLVAQLVAPADASGFELLLFLGAFLFVVTLLFTIFFQWVIKQDLGEPK